jgi:hypothetical protein
MPPKHPPRRGRKHGLPGAPALAEVALKDLRRAHNLVERGDHGNAAQLFERQARESADVGIFLPAAHLYLQAGRAKLLEGETKIAELLLLQGLEILYEYVNQKRLALSGNQVINDLLNLGHNQLAVDVRSWLEQALENNPDLISGILNDLPDRTMPPIRCLHCNAILRQADIEQWETGRDVCVFCGSLIES